MLTYASVVFTHVEQTILAAAFITSPCVFTFTVWALANLFLFALIHIYHIQSKEYGLVLYASRPHEYRF